MTVSAKLDTSGWAEGLAQLSGPLRESLARSMAVAGGRVLRDEAKHLAPKESGLLASSIYLAHKEGRSTEAQVVYSVSWNSKVAPHGHLIEFGHWQKYVVKKLPNGDWFTTDTLLPAPKFVPAHPFLRPALDSAGKRAQQAMVDRGRVRLKELLNGDADGA